MVRLTGGSEKAEFIPDGLPAAKDAIEKEICAGAARSMRFHGWNTWPLEGEPRQLAEDDFDFAFATTGDPEYLDLAEVAPLKGVRGNYEGVPTTFARGKLVDAILRLVEKKGFTLRGSAQTEGCAGPGLSSPWRLASRWAPRRETVSALVCSGRRGAGARPKQRRTAQPCFRTRPINAIFSET